MPETINDVGPPVRPRTDRWFELPASYADGDSCPDPVKVRAGTSDHRVSLEIAGVVREVYTKDLREAIERHKAEAAR